MHGDGTCVQPGTPREEEGGAENDSNPPDLVHTIVPAVGGCDYSVGADQRTTANTSAIAADDGEEETSLENHRIYLDTYVCNNVVICSLLALNDLVIGIVNANSSG